MDKCARVQKKPGLGRAGEFEGNEARRRSSLDRALKRGRRVPDPSHQDFNRPWPPAIEFRCANSTPRPADSSAGRQRSSSSWATGPSCASGVLARLTLASHRADQQPTSPHQLSKPEPPRSRCVCVSQSSLHDLVRPNVYYSPLRRSAASEL